VAVNLGIDITPKGGISIPEYFEQQGRKEVFGFMNFS